MTPHIFSLLTLPVVMTPSGGMFGRSEPSDLLTLGPPPRNQPDPSRAGKLQAPAHLRTKMAPWQRGRR